MSDVVLFQPTKTKIFLELLPKGHIFVDWSNLPKHENIHQYVIHYKSLNNNQSHAIRVSCKKQNIILRKIQLGHLYEIHVCTVDDLNKIITSSEHAQIQTIALNKVPILRVTKSTPDFIWLEWEISDDVQLSDIESYKLIINGQTKAIFPSTENKFIVNDGKLGERYIFQLEVSRKDGKVISSLPININWPGVTVPKHHAFVNGGEELIICWGESTSINDGNIESYTLYLYDAEGNLSRKIGPNSSECRQIWIKDMTKGVYFYVLKMKLVNSNKFIYSKPMKIECGRESKKPILTCNYIDSSNRKQLINMIYHLIKIRDNIKSKKYLFEKCENQLEQILSILTNLTDFIRLNLTIESKSNENISKTHQLFIDNQESPISIPGFVKDFPLELPRRDKPYELVASVIPDLYGIKSKKVLVEAYDQFTFFCNHFNQQRSIENCSYMKTLLYEKQLKRSIHQGLLKFPETMNNIQIYDLNKNKIISLPLLNKSCRLSIIFFYINQCIPSINHLNYFSTYASLHRTKYNYLSINCNQNNIDHLKILTQNLNHIQCYTDFSSDDFQYEQKENDKPLYELLSIDGVPTYFILDFSNRIVWKGRLCIQNQLEYNQAIDHIISEVNKLQCSTENCELCHYCLMNDARIDSELNIVAKNLQSIVQQRSLQSENKQQEGDKHNRKRRVLSIKKKSNTINNNEY